jgi:hypothetical protein
LLKLDQHKQTHLNAVVSTCSYLVVFAVLLEGFDLLGARACARDQSSSVFLIEARLVGLIKQVVLCTVPELEREVELVRLQKARQQVHKCWRCLIENIDQLWHELDHTDC